MNLSQLTNDYAIPENLSFEETKQGLICACISNEVCKAAIYLQGAHLTEWQPSSHKPVLFLSDRSDFLPGRAIRGGVPIIFPWFGARTATSYSQRTDGPLHGFARTSQWTLVDATVDGGDVHVTLMLDPHDTTRALGWDDFRVFYKLAIGKELDLQLIVENRSQSTMIFEEALHSYFMVSDVRQISIKGLANTEYLDKTDGFRRKRQQEPSLTLTGETDRPYLNTESTVQLEDGGFRRRIEVWKEHSRTTVIWNPWSELSRKLSDMNPDGWQRMLCVETANASANAVSLESGHQHTMHARITVNEV